MAANANPRHSMPPGGYLARNSISSGAPRPSPAPLPHIQDLVAIPKDVNPNQSIRKLLEQAEISFKQSEMHRDFNKPAMALKDYIRAFVIAVDIVQKHPDCPAMTSQQGDTFALHRALLSKINRQSEIYNQIKKDIIADNQRTGVQPTTAKNPPVVTSANGQSTLPPSNTGAQLASQEDRHQQLANGHTPRLPNGGSPAKTKPAVHPKPASLHGNAIPPRHDRTNSANNITLDLAARFANLRGPQPSPGQDPRIKTYSIIPEKPSGPRQMPRPSPPKMNIDINNDATLPKLPDAIYSPVRGSVSGEAARLPTSTPRGLFSRTGSFTSMAGTPGANQSRQSDEYFPLVPTTSSTKSDASEQILKLPEGNTITPQEFNAIRSAKASVLFIDVRPREDFDEGHIMAVSIICIEPSILERENLTCSDISDSLVLSPSTEHSLFEKRQSYDLVVFYDQGSECLPKSDKDPLDVAIWSLNRALVELNYGTELKNPPRLLKGGIDAWTDLYGVNSLRSTPTSKPKAQPVNGKRQPLIQRRGSKYVFGPLPEKDVETFRKGLEKDAAPSFPRTRDEFLRFPPVSTEQQSMTSVTAAQQRYKHDLTNRFGSPAHMLAPPTRPQAAVQRPTHTSLSQDDHDDHEAAEQVPAVPAKVHTGLNNPGNWCYANSLLQSLLASPNFGRELADSEWARRYKNQVPRKQGEKIDQPQLMIQMLSNIFYWMSSGKFQTMKAQMLMEYSRHLCETGDPKTKFGGRDQQDAQEFMSFLMDQLHDETNLRRDQKGQVNQPDAKGKQLVQAAAEYWENHKRWNDSIVDEYWRGLQLSTVKCHQCSTQTYTFSQFESLGVNVPGNRNMTLAEALRQANAGDEIEDFTCNHCKGPRPARIFESLARMPPLLSVSFRRFHVNERGVVKSTGVVAWDFNDFDFTPYFLNSVSDWQDARIQDRAFCGPFRYECYAVIIHSGRSIDSGHYYAYVRDSSTHDPYAWYCCNDSTVTKVRIGSRDQADIQNRVFKQGDAVPYLAFFRRKSA